MCSVGIYNCRKERNFRTSIKYRCGVCQSCKDTAKSELVTRLHVNGKLCTGGNKHHCSICAQIKFKLALLKHLAGHCSKRCQVCASQHLEHYLLCSVKTPSCYSSFKASSIVLSMYKFMKPS